MNKSCTIPKTKLSRDILSMVKAIHRQRTHLVNSGLNRKNTAHMQASLDRLQPYLTYNFTDTGAARFLIKYKADIRAIMRDKDMVVVARFDMLLTAAHFFINPQIPIS